jgi:hypothetical protein
MRALGVVVHVARGHHVRSLIHQAAPAGARGTRTLLSSARHLTRRSHARVQHAYAHFMLRVSSTLTDVPATSATTPGVCGSQHPAAMVADGSSEEGTAPMTLGAPACAERGRGGTQ